MTTYAAFIGQHKIAAGTAEQIARQSRAASTNAGSMLLFDDRTGEQLEIDLHGSDADIERRIRASTNPASTIAADAPRTAGRPKLGVVAREVTLLPRHWEWLGTQPGGASVALRKLVEQASRRDEPMQRRRHAQEASYRFMTAMAGNLPGFEEALRALFASNLTTFREQTDSWPSDIRDHARQLAQGVFEPHE